jgi:ketosteroid isomerase-like protein
VSAETVEVVRRLNSAFNAGDWDGFFKLLDPSIEFVDHLPLPDVQATAHGVEQAGSVLEHWREGFSGFHAEVLEYLDVDDYVVCSTRWTFKSRDNEIELSWTGAEAHQVRDGKLVWSAAGFPDKLAALGALEQRIGRAQQAPAPRD